MKNKDNLILRIVAVAFLISVVVGFILFFKAIDQNKVIIQLIEERFQWCNSFNQLKEITDNIILNYVNVSFELNQDINCSLLMPIGR